MPQVSKPASKGLNGVLKQASKPRPPLWEGPQSRARNGGVTQGLIGRFLCCRERFRLHAMEGLRGANRWNHRTGYGDLWHVCEEAVAAGNDWSEALAAEARSALADHKLQQDEILKWHDVCSVQFPIYLAHWQKHQAKEKLTNIKEEFEFCVPYQLPSGRVVYLKGKMDRIDQGMLHGRKGVLLGEHKTKGDVDVEAIKRQLRFDLQTMLYLVALRQLQEHMDPPMAKFMGPVLGVRYNVVRRPLSGGKHTITQHKEKSRKPRIGKTGKVLDPGKLVPAETWPDFCARLGGLIAGDPDHFFQRFAVAVTQQDMDSFRRRTLDPVLEQMCDWYQDVDGRADPFDSPLHYVFPFGVVNPLTEGLSTDLEECVLDGTVGAMRRTDRLFPELETL